MAARRTSLNLTRIFSFTSTRQHGDAKKSSDLRRLLRVRKVSSNLATGQQVHGTRIQVVSKLKKPRTFLKTDGLLTAEAGQPLGIYTADCASIFLSAPTYGLVGCLHAGWRGVAGGILPKALRLMVRRWRCRPQAVRVSIGPSIRSCCFEVQWDVARHFPATRRRRQDRWTVDLQREVERQARQAGARVVRVGRLACTRHQPVYHSYRRDQTKARQISVITRTH
jgi:YfiH family protein